MSLYLHYATLDKLPGLVRDQYGNLNLAKEGSGLRGRVEYVLKLNTGLLAGVQLADMLDWLRWSSECSIMWECTLPELIQIIEKWLGDNPDGTQELYGFHGDPAGADWEKLWTERGRKTYVRPGRRCPCLKVHREFEDCRKCRTPWYDMDSVMLGPRGTDTYNLELMGAAGSSIAAAVWNNRHWLLIEPEGFFSSPYNQVYDLLYA